MAPDNAAEIKALEADRGDYLGYVRLAGRRQTNLADQLESSPAQHVNYPRLRAPK